MALQARVMFFDLDRCVGCHACETACKMENDVVPGPKWIEVVQREIPRKDGGWTVEYLPLNCRHCAEPLCQAVCPMKAIQRRTDGLVLVNIHKCIGCTECLQVCPFGAPQFGPLGTMEKCTMCAHRISLGLPTACEQLCPTGAIWSGTTGEISKRVRSGYSITVIRRELESS